MVHPLALGVVAGYGVLSLAGGVMGYVKAKSRASLIAGGASGLLLLGSAALATTHPLAGLALASGAAVMVPSLAVLAITLIAVIAAFL